MIKKLNKRQFADSLGINQSVAGDIELGKREPSRDVLMKLATNYKVNINWLFTGDGAMFITGHEFSKNEEQQSGEDQTAGSIIIGKAKEVEHIGHNMLNIGIQKRRPAPVSSVDKEKTMTFFEIPLLTKEQVLHFEPGKEIPDPKAHTGEYPDYTLIPIPRRFQEYSTDLRATVVFNSLMSPLLNQGDVTIFQALDGTRTGSIFTG
jgi:transcriptional regulator with XRE-family HTH domain